MAEWSEVLLGNLASEITVGHVGPMTSEYRDEGIPFLRSQNVLPHRLDLHDVKYVHEGFHQKLKKSALSPGDVVVVRTGKPGAAAVVPASLGPANCADLVIVRPGPSLDSRWLSYYINAAAGHFVASRLVGAVQQHFNVGSARELMLTLPLLSEQRAIAELLSALDDKIESNRRIADLVEETTSQDLWRHRERTGMTAEFGQLVEFNPDVVRPGSSDDHLLYIDIASVMPGRLGPLQPMSWGDAPSRARRGVRDGDVIFSTVRPGRRSFALVVKPDPTIVVSTGFAVLRPKPPWGSSLVAAVVAEQPFAEYLEGVAHGSAYPAVSTKNMAGYEVEVPTPEAAVRFEEETMPLRRRAAVALHESEALTALRDALLPELLSGRLRVPEAEELVDAV